MRVSIVVAVALSASLLHAGVNTVPHVVPMPDLTVAGAKQPPFVLANPCGVGESAITFWLTVHNGGAAASAASSDPHIVWVQDSANAGWAAGSLSPLSAIAPGASVPVSVTLLGLKNPDAMAGHHVFNVTLNGAKTIPESSYANNTMTIAVDFPPGFCAPVVPVAGGSSITKTPGTQPAPKTVNPQNVLPANLPAPTNLNNTITQSVCAKYGGAAASLACSIGIPAGKLVLVWDYPFTNAIDGFRVYRVGGTTPVATQTVQGVRLMVLDPPPAGTCFNVSAFHGTNESSRSATSFCFAQSNVSKTVTIKADRTYSKYALMPYDPSRSILEQSNDPSHAFDTNYLGYLIVGSARFRSQGDTSNYTTNWVYFGYADFDLSSVAGKQVIKAQLNVLGGKTTSSTAQKMCVSRIVADSSNYAGTLLNSGVAGPDVHVDATAAVKAAVSAPKPQTSMEMSDDHTLSIYGALSVTTTCTTTFSTVTLDVTYF